MGLNVLEFMDKAMIESKRREFIVLLLKAALGAGDIKPYDDIERAVEKVSQTFVQLQHLWKALLEETKGVP